MMSFIEDSFPQLIFEGIPVPSLHLKLAKPIFAVLPFDLFLTRKIPSQLDLLDSNCNDLLFEGN